MRVYISSTPEELRSHQAAARDVAADLGFDPVLRDANPGQRLDPVAACARQVAAADVVLAIVGWRRGRVPPPELGGDGLRFWTWWEVRSAFDHGKPVVVLMAAGSWRPSLREDDPRARAIMRDFRGELERVAVFFDDGPGDSKPDSDREPPERRPSEDFRELVRRELTAARKADRAADLSAGIGGTRLRRPPPPRLPDQPYPLLLPYTHPDLLAGRERELQELQQTLAWGLPIVGLHAPSGTGKSSLLAGALVPRCRAQGRPVAFDRRPAEPGLAGRLIDDLLEVKTEAGTDLAATDHGAFIDYLSAVRRLTDDGVPLLVVDQFEDLLRSESARAARAAIGLLLAASVQRQPDLDGPPCQWLLAYRREFHGEVLYWLYDVLRDARAEGIEAPSLPHELSRSERFCSWPLQPLATPRVSPSEATALEEPSEQRRVAEAARIFRQAIEKPLALTTPEGEPCYPWTFAPGHAARLARAFGAARLAQPEASLLPELQVVLAHLLAETGTPESGVRRQVRVPAEPGEMIDRALEEHLRRALDIAYPATPSQPAPLPRTRALLALRELAESGGRRQQGLPESSLSRAIGGEVLEALATPQTRLVVPEARDGGRRYVLSHDRLAELLVRLVDREDADARLGIDPDVLGLRRFVVLQSQLYASGDVDQATVVPSEHFGNIEANQEVLLWHDQQRTWWQACRLRRRRERRRNAVRRVVATSVATVMALVAWTVADRRARQRALLEEIASGEPEVAFATLDQLAREGHDPQELRDHLSRRDQPFDIFERGLGGVGEERRAAVVLRLAKLVLPILEASAAGRGVEESVLIASLVWALDYSAIPDPAATERALAVRDEVLAPLRRRRPPPLPKFCPPAAYDPSWAAIPAGTFWMGASPSDRRDDPDMQDEFPRHRVTLAAFQMMTHEVTNAEYRRLVPDHPGAGNLPANFVTWHEAYTYAAWLGGRLPTEPEWEYAARAGCTHAFCRGDGSAATLSEVAWWVGNSADQVGEASVKPVMQLAPNPWGLYDVFGNVREWNANWYYLYPEQQQQDPLGPPFNRDDVGMNRGGSVRDSREAVAASARGGDPRVISRAVLGLRVILPAALRESLESRLHCTG